MTLVFYGLVVVFGVLVGWLMRQDEKAEEFDRILHFNGLSRPASSVRLVSALTVVLGAVLFVLAIASQPL